MGPRGQGGPRAGGQAADSFISYTSADRTWAEWIAWTLEQAGYQVIVQDWDFEPGDNFMVRTQCASDRTDRTPLVLGRST